MLDGKAVSDPPVLINRNVTFSLLRDDLRTTVGDAARRKRTNATVSIRFSGREQLIFGDGSNLGLFRSASKDARTESG